MFNIIALFLAPLTCVTSIYGMRCNVPFQTNHQDELPPYVTSPWERFVWMLHHTKAFWGLTFGSLLVTLILMCIMRKKKYI
jgi:Mg2+ and Co2+ transporter CorA